MLKKQPIGIFDSGVGGLTVFREIRKHFPQEDIVYFGDTARVPYGPKSPQTVLSYSIQNARFLMQCSAKILVVACNTSTAVALEALQMQLTIPVIGVIEPGARAAVSLTRNKRIGVIGTEGTINSGAYERTIRELDPNCRIISQACPLFVPLVEEGWEDHPVARTIASEYIAPLISEGIDTLVLGCTHYPILKPVLSSILGPGIQLVDSAEAIVSILRENISSVDHEPGENLFYVSDNEPKFRQIAARILGQDTDDLTRVALGESWYTV